jgi:hypothetical protein
MTAQILAVVVLVAFLIAVVCSLFGAVDAWLRKRNQPGPDVGVDIVDCGMVADVPTADSCPVCDGEGIIGDEEAWEMCFLCPEAEAS